MLYLIIAFLLSFGTCFLLIKRASEACIDCQAGVQKFHTWQAVRIGGLAIAIALVGLSVAFILAKKEFAKEHVLFLLCGVPVFLGGLLEDLTKKVPPKLRLLAGGISGLLAYFLLSTHLTRLDVPVIDELLSHSLLLSILFTSFALAGVANAMNIIDGFNGLASGVCIMVFLSYAYLSFVLGDFFLLYTSLTIVASILGFFFWNFPFGYIFLGDGGAYLLGFFAGLIGVLLVERHAEVSPWFPFLLLLYPIYETLFSIFRKKFWGNASPFEPDAVHLHMLIHKRIVRLHLGNLLPSFLTNSFTSLYLWFMQLFCTVSALLFWDKTYLLIFFSTGFILFYTWLYFRIVRFKTPGFMQILLRRFKEL